MSSPSSAIIKERVEDGLYDLIGEQIVAMEKAALASAEYDGDFKRHIEGWSKNYVYKDIGGAEFRTIIVGEIKGPESGTVITAKGNHYPGPKGTPFRPITDESRVKDVVVIGVPTGATDLLKIIFENQIATLNSILEADELTDKAHGMNPIIKEWVRAADGPSNIPKDSISIHMLPKYGRPAGEAGKIGGKRQIVKKSLAANGQEVNGESSKSAETIPIIREGAFYDPHLNADYGGAYFQHTYNKLVQLDVRDENDALVAPWTYPTALRAGTVVLINASLHCFVISDKNVERKVYQINAHSIRILASSDTVVPAPVRPEIPNDQSEAESVLVNGEGGVSASAAAAFNSFTMTRRFRSDVDGGITNDVGEKKTRKGKKKESGVTKVASIMDMDLNVSEGF